MWPDTALRLILYSRALFVDHPQLFKSIWMDPNGFNYDKTGLHWLASIRLIVWGFSRLCFLFVFHLSGLFLWVWSLVSYWEQEGVWLSLCLLLLSIVVCIHTKQITFWPCWLVICQMNYSNTAYCSPLMEINEVALWCCSKKAVI